MADDVDLLAGKWSVVCGRWNWEYTFARDGSVRWYDPNVKEGGSGRWAKRSQDGEEAINLSWTGSPTKEYWKLPISIRDQKGHVSAQYGEYDTTAQKIVDKTAELEEEVRKLHTDGQISFAGSTAGTFFKQALNHERVDGFEARHSLPLLRTIIALTANAGSLKILRTFAPNQGPHGSGGRCEAMDIAVFGTVVFEYHTTKRSLIDGVANLIRAMPEDITFDLGLVRPVGGVGGFNTALDVFFTVTADNVRKLKRDPTTHKVLPGQSPNAVEPGTGWGLGALLPDAKRAIDVARTGKKLSYVYPDGADHVHIRAY